MIYVICMSDWIIDVPLVCAIRHFIFIVCDGRIFTANPGRERFFERQLLAM